MRLAFVQYRRESAEVRIVTDILIIDDDPELGKLLSDFLIKEGFSIRLCADAEKALGLFEKESFRLILLDVMLPNMDGFETCSVIRDKSNIPILMMSAKNNESEKLLGYETGADDYIDKPFSIKVLYAKIRVLLKRCNEAVVEADVLREEGVVLDCNSRRAMVDGKECQLNVKEFELLKYLMSNPRRAIDRDELFDNVWGNNCFTEPSTVSVHIRWLREKLEKDPNSPQIIQTVHKIGYRFGGRE